MSGLVDEKNQSSDRWEEVARLTKQIGAIAPTISKLTPSSEGTLLTASSFARLLKDDHEHYFIYAVNTDTSRPQTVSITFGAQVDVDAAPESSRLPDNGKVPVTHEGAQTSWQAKLDPGDGALFRID